MMNEEVRNIMTKDPVVVGPDERIDSMTQMIIEKGIQQLPVVVGGQFKE